MMKSILFLLFFVPLISAKEDVFRTVTHICLGDGKLKFQVNITANDTVNDIFSTDPQNSCSLSNNDFLGNGTEDFPYTITVDVSKHLKSLHKPCGAEIFNGSFKVEFAIKSLENFFSKHDRIYSMECRLSNPQVSVFTIKLLSNKLYQPNEVPITMKLVSSNSVDIPDGRVNLGQKVKLKVEFLKSSFAKRGHVTWCFVQDTLHDNATFYKNKCPVKGFPVPINFVTNKTNPKLIESTEFKAFRFNNNENVQFTCYVELCTKETDPYCLATDCVPIGTFMHSYTKVKTLVHAVISGATNQMSFTLMPVTAIMIFLTKINWF